MAYVDLNPIRARMALTPEQSEHTSIKRRIEQVLKTQQDKSLLAFAGNPRKDMPRGLPFQLTDYLELVDWSGRIIREDKKGAIDNALPDILQRLNIEAKHFIYLAKHFEQPFTHLVGTAYHVRQACEEIGQHWVHGIRHCEMFFSSR